MFKRRINNTEYRKITMIYTLNSKRYFGDGEAILKIKFRCHWFSIEYKCFIFKKNILL